MPFAKYNEKAKAQIYAYRKANQKEIKISYKNDEWNNIAPLIKNTGKPVATFIKEAIMEKLMREGNSGE